MTPLEALLREIIAAEGPITLERYMALALGHPRHGYYMTRDPLGAAGDFTTAPEISQMFGELLGLWVAEIWSGMGRPSPVRLVELGPGRGTLMADALRAARAVPGFLDAIEVHLVETSPVLRRRQAATLGPAGPQPNWHAQTAEIPSGPAIVLANEFLDALPIRQFMRGERGWHERLVGLDAAGRLAFGLAPDPEPGLGTGGHEGDIVELPAAGSALVRDLATRLVTQGGAALFIDYGHTRRGTGETLQAVRGHAHADPLARPGEQDLTAHVDFAAVARSGSAAGATVHGPVTQAEFLEALGIRVRAERLKQGARSPEQAAAVDAAFARLTARGERDMGTLFKALAITGPGLTSVPGFQPAAFVTRDSRMAPAPC